MTPAPEHLPYDALPVPVAVMAQQRVAYVNPALCVLMGHPPEALLGLTREEYLARFIPTDQRWLAPLREARAPGELGSLWVRLRTASGEERLFHVRYGQGPRPGDEVVVLLDVEGLASVRRFTEALVRAAGELVHQRTETAVLEAAAEALHQQGFNVGVLLLVGGDTLVHGPLRQDPELVAFSEQLYGRPLAEVRFPVATVPHVSESFRTQRATFHQDALAPLDQFHVPELLARLRARYPGARAVEAPIFVEGAPYGVLSVQSPELTPASAATVALFARQVGGALENVRAHARAAEQLVELQRLQGELVARERLSVLGEAAAVVAHEVRNPLGAILNAVAVLKRESPRVGPVGAQAVGMLEEEAQRLDAVVRDLLDVVRPLEPRLKPVALGELARRVVALAGPRRHDLALEVEEEPELPPVAGDESLLQLALEHLLRNAQDASPAGGTVRLALSRGGAGVVLTVEDEGPGLPEGPTARLFEPFFTTRVTGTGLGLAVVRRVLLAHGGTVSARGRPGGGARFELSLPLAP